MAARHIPVTAWAGWIAGPAGWLIQHQGGSDTVYWNCALGRPSLVVTLGVVGALVALAGGWLSWRAARAAGPVDSESPGRGSQRFIGTLGALAVAIVLVAITGQTMAGLILQGCGR
ncbi:hypothetical protein [Azospirillum sp. TSO35-2]|uniref:hypothetical protein n=1 Tax=Azospirillum sp. TSO35-2 TaxID=716796 RepID=UPI000D65BB9D|nr:hypothetical protein [Azospirillum sp. TSO35-2]